MEENYYGFIVGLPRSRDGYDSIWAIMDRLTNTTHFLPVKAAISVAKLYVKHIMCLHGVPVSMATDRGFIFTS